MKNPINSNLGASIQFHAIGYVRSPHCNPDLTPIQPIFAEGITGSAEIFPEYEAALQDIEGFTHVIILYHLHLVDTVSLVVKPFLEDQSHGVLATRHPCRPNPIGLSILPLLAREGNTLTLGNVDILDGTPILDIKPYVKRFDCPSDIRDGWISKIDKAEAKFRGQRCTTEGVGE